MQNVPMRCTAPEVIILYCLTHLCVLLLTESLRAWISSTKVTAYGNTWHRECIFHTRQCVEGCRLVPHQCVCAWRAQVAAATPSRGGRGGGAGARRWPHMLTGCHSELRGGREKTAPSSLQTTLPAKGKALAASLTTSVCVLSRGLGRWPMLQPFPCG